MAVSKDEREDGTEHLRVNKTNNQRANASRKVVRNDQKSLLSDIVLCEMHRMSSTYTNKYS